MIVKKVEFGHVLCASGAMGFAGEGYAYHKLPIPGFSFEGCTFVSKTTTLEARVGNMALRNDLAPTKLLPDCIKTYPLKGMALNAVGLSGPGAEAVIDLNLDAERTDPWWFSFMSVAGTPIERLNELERFLKIFEKNLEDLKRFAPVGLQINVSCPNTEHAASEDEWATVLDMAGKLGIPLMLKVAVDAPREVVAKIAWHDHCHSLCITNTVKFGNLPDRIDWKRLFGTTEPQKSPLAKYGGGGLSGKPLLPLVEEIVKHLRTGGCSIPINAGGGILSPRDVRRLKKAGADSVFVGSIAFLRPWRLQSVIRTANYEFAA